MKIKSSNLVYLVNAKRMEDGVEFLEINAPKREERI